MNEYFLEMREVGMKKIVPTVGWSGETHSFERDRSSMKKVLSIAGSDSGGGAGIQADIKTITAHKLYAMTAITSLTAQNTLGVQGIFPVDPNFLKKQLDSVFTDLFPDSVKIGMLCSAPLAGTVADCLTHYRPKNIVLDPVMLSTSGSRLLDDDAVELLIRRLFPLADLITPNLPEAERISGLTIRSRTETERAARAIAGQGGCAVLIKGGHWAETADDLLFDGERMHWFPAERVDNPNTHGTGCTLSSAIACQLAQGVALHESVLRAKEYLTGALRAGLNLGQGSGPLNHCYAL